MALSDHLKKPEPKGVEDLLRVLDDNDRATLLEALDPDSEFRHVDIARAIRMEGYDVPVTADQIRKYRNKLKEARDG